MRKPYVNFRELKAAVGIRRVLERYNLLETLREQGSRLSGPCPICGGEGGTSFRVCQEKNCFMCFRCQTGGNMLDFVATMEDCSVRDASVKVAEWFEIETDRPGRASASKSAKTSEKKAPPPAAKSEDVPPAPAVRSEPDVPAAREPEPAMPAPSGSPPLTFELKLEPEHPWFAQVGLTPETVRKFGLGFCARGMMGGRIAFPIRNAKGELVGYAGRWPGEVPPDGQPLWRYPKGLDLDHLVYPAERLAEADLTRALLARDPLQVLLCLQMGLDDVFFVPAEASLEGALSVIGRAQD